MVKIKVTKGTSIPFANKNIEESTFKPIIDTFLKLIKINIDKIKSTNNMKYSLLSCIFLCFYEKRKKILNKNEIYDFIKNEIKEHKNKIVLSCFKIKESDSNIVTQKNYYLKLCHIFRINKCFIKLINIEHNSEEKIELNEDYIISHRKSIYINIFGHSFKAEKLKSPTNTKKLSTVKKRKFQNCLSIKKINKTKNEDKDDNEKEEDKENKIKSKILFNIVKENKGKEKTIFYSNKENEKKKKVQFFTTNIEILGKEEKKPNYLNKKRKTIFVTTKPNNCLIMPLFADESSNNHNNKENVSNINYSDNKKFEIASSSNKEMSYINNLANQFILYLKSPRIVTAIRNGNAYIRLNGKILLNYEDDPIINDLLKASMGEYLKFCGYIEYFMGNNKSLSDNEDDNDNDRIYYNKEKHLIENFKAKKKRCSFLINKIIIRLNQFLTEYDYIVRVIKDLYEHEKKINPLKELLHLIDNNKTILCKENILYFEKILFCEFDNATNFFMINYGLMNKI